MLSLEWSEEGLPKVARDYRARYRAIRQVLDEHPEILDLVHKDLRKLSHGDSRGRKGDYASENILRALVVQHLEGLPFRGAGRPFSGSHNAHHAFGFLGRLVITM